MSELEVNMTALDELIETANRLSQRLEQAANNEKKWCVDIQLRFEQMSWECLRLANEMQEIKNYI
jgi:hypothetical protein